MPGVGLPRAVGYRVWLGSQEAGYCGCGIIVDDRHVVSCNHVVRQSLAKDLYGDSVDDLKGRRLMVRCPTGLVECEVVRNVPLPSRDFGEQPFHDLALLRRTDGSSFAPGSAAILASSAVEEQLLRENRAKFAGTGLGSSAGSQQLAAQFMSVPFEGRLLVRAEFKYWYHTSEDLGHLISEHGCSGGAAVSVALPDTVLGLVQGGLKIQTGLVIPAAIVGSFLEASGIRPRWLTEIPDITERPTALRTLRKKPAALALRPELLAECDRTPQKQIFQSASVTFLQANGKCLFLAISGGQQDLPDLSNRKFSGDSVRAYWDWMRVMLNESTARKVIDNYPSICVRFGGGDAPVNEAACLCLLANGLASDTRLRNKVPDARILLDAMESIDSPIVVFLLCEAAGFSDAALAAWQSCIGKLANARARRPLITILFVDCANEPPMAIPALDGVSVLPALGALTRQDVEEWANSLFFHEEKKAAAIMARVEKDSFPLAQLRDWLFSEAR